MNDEQLTAEVKALEQRLTELWGWGDLGRIGWNMNILFLDRETGNRDQVDAGHEMDTKRETLLATSYGSAIAEIDRVLPTLPQGPVLTALLERLQRRLRSIGEHSFHYYLEREFQPSEEHFDNGYDNLPGAELSRLTDEHQQMTRAAWQCVEGSLSEYLGRVADHVAAATAGTKSVGTPTLDRIRWIGPSTAVYVHIVKELLAKGYIELPGMNGKAGDGNITELFQRLSQAFIIAGKNGNELPAAELQRRYNGRPLATAKAIRLNLPEAKDVK
jgi:hypothetical protein